MTVTLTVWHLVNGGIIAVIIYLIGFNVGWHRGFNECKGINDRLRSNR